MRADHAELVTNTQLRFSPGRTWYLPNHPVLNSKKPDKVRIVFDCSVVYPNISLNSQVFKGPNLNNELLGVLMFFDKDKPQSWLTKSKVPSESCQA